MVQTDMVAAFVALQLAFLIKMVDNYQRRKAYAEYKESQGYETSFLGATGLTTVFNALT